MKIKQEVKEGYLGQILAHIERSRSNLFFIIPALLFSLSYILFIYRQYSSIFFEIQFLHLNFIKDLVNNSFNVKNFFTVFGEHLISGYNIILALNYYLFDLSGGFDIVISTLITISTSILMMLIIFQLSEFTKIEKILLNLLSQFILLSTVNNPSFAMSLSASLGVMLFLLSIYLFEKYFYSSRTKNYFFLAPICLLIAIIFFLGAYSVGAVASIFTLCFLFYIHQIKFFKYSIIFFSTLFSFLIYILLIRIYGNLLANGLHIDLANLQNIIKFIFVISGASILGKSFYEAYGLIWPYYTIGFLLLTSIIIFCWKFILNKPQKGFLFFVLSLYSLINILFVSLFRFKNGLDGAMGQWYVVHTHFIVISTFYFIISTLKRNIKTIYAYFIKFFLLPFFVFFAIAGYSADWKKSPYIPAWKNQFVLQVPKILSFSDLIRDKNDPFETMLWNYSDVRNGLNFLYENHLWIFKHKDPVLFGLTVDNWIEKERNFFIICPKNTTTLKFKSWRPVNEENSYLNVMQGVKSFRIALYEENNQIKINSGDPIFFFDTKMSNPFKVGKDDRNLVSNITNVTCS